MDVTLRLNKDYDLDLITLYKSSKFKFSTEIRNVLKAYAKGELYNIELPKYIPEHTKNNQRGLLDESGLFSLNSIIFHVHLDPIEDEEAIQMLIKIRIRKRNQFIKNLFRSYLPGPVLYAYHYEYDKAVKRDEDVRNKLRTKGESNVETVIKEDNNSHTEVKTPKKNKERVAEKPPVKAEPKVDLNTEPPHITEPLEVEDEEEKKNGGIFDMFDSMMDSFNKS